jgi:cytochrome P450
MQNKTTNDINLLALRKHYTNPYGLYTILREKDQIYFDETSQSWLVTSYDAITALLNDARFVSGLGAAANSSSPHLSSLKRLNLFIAEFYEDQRVDSDVHLIMEPLGLSGHCLLKSQGADFQEFRDQDEKIRKLQEYQAEMNAFAAFLHKHFFE